MHASPVAIAESFEHDDGITAEAAALHRIATSADEETRMRQEREEALHWATHIDLLTDRLPPTVLFCGGGSMMKTAEW